MLLFVGCLLTSTITELNEVLGYLDKRIRHHLGIFSAQRINLKQNMRTRMCSN